jgi:Zn-dependent oligopeptidase
LRNALAAELGYASYTDYAHRFNMNNSADQLNKYIDELLVKLKPMYINYLNQLRRFATENVLIDVEAYDIEYYDKKYDKEILNVNEDEIHKYFPIFKVLEEVLKIYGEIMNFTFKEITEENRDLLWYKDVRLYDVYEDGKIIGRLFVDILYRKGKSMMNQMITINGKSHTTLPFLGISCVFSKTYPGDLEIDEIRSLFHELGHAMHNFSLNSYITRVSKFMWEFDFNEIPSQMFEQLAHEPDILRRILKITVPEENQTNIIERVIKDILKYKKRKDLSWFNDAYRSKLDLIVHSNEYKDYSSLDDLVTKLSIKVYGYDRNAKTPDTGTIVNIFSVWPHPMIERYAAGYNTYVTTYGYALDLFREFKRDGKEVKALLLSHGAAKKSLNAIYNFLKRDPKPANAFAALFATPEDEELILGGAKKCARKSRLRKRTRKIRK